MSAVTSVVGIKEIGALLGGPIRVVAPAVPNTKCALVRGCNSSNASRWSTLDKLRFYVFG